MKDFLLLELGIILLLTGIAGCILPVIPGPPISFLGLLVLKFTRYVEPARMNDFNELLWIFALASIVVTLLDYVVPIWGTKRYGGSKAGTWGAALGVVFGLILSPITGPLGIIIGPFAGAVAGELIAGKDNRSSLRSGFGSFLGFLTGVIMKLIVSFLITFYFIRELFVTI